MNWIKKLFRSKKADEPKNSALNKYIVSCSLREQIRQRQDDYYMLIKSNRKNIEVLCKEPIIEWSDDGKDKRERYLRRKRLEKYEMFLYSKIEMLELLRGLEENCN